MCFRPPDANISKKCGKCGTENEFTATVCAECGADLPEGMGAPGMPSAPGMPKAPGMPGAPGAPMPPTTPKVPGR